MTRLATRKSPLAQAQTDRVLALLPDGGARKLVLESEGDLDTISPLHNLGAPGAFTRTLTAALLDGRADAAVHSLKDLPLAAPDDAPVVAVLPRDDPADVLLVRTDAHDPDAPLQLRPGSRVGTSAPRRQSQVRDADPRLVPVDVRGNVGTRVGLLAAGVVDGLLMAAAVLDRIDLPLPDGVRVVRLDPTRFPGGPGQGTIAVQVRRDAPGLAHLRALDHEPTRRAVEAERGVLRALGGGCGLPLGVHVHHDGRWHLHATFDHPTGLTRVDLTGDDPEALAAEATDLLRVAPAPATEPPRGDRVVLVSMEGPRLDAYQRVLGPAGFDVRPWPLVSTEETDAPLPPGATGCGWIAVTSPRAARHARAAVDALGRLPRIAAVGAATAAALRRHDLPVHVVAADGTGTGLADDIARFPKPAEPVLWPCAERPAGGLAEGLEGYGYPVVSWPVYRTAPRAPDAPADRADTLVLASPSAVAAYRSHPSPPAVDRVVAFGPTTADAARAAGLPLHAALAARTPHALLESLT